METRRHVEALLGRRLLLLLPGCVLPEGVELRGRLRRSVGRRVLRLLLILGLTRLVSRHRSGRGRHEWFGHADAAVRASLGSGHKRWRCVRRCEALLPEICLYEGRRLRLIQRRRLRRYGRLLLKKETGGTRIAAHHLLLLHLLVLALIPSLVRPRIVLRTVVRAALAALSSSVVAAVVP